MDMTARKKLYRFRERLLNKEFLLQPSERKAVFLTRFLNYI